METVFTGFDSAWGGRAPGAICDLELRTNDSGSSLFLKNEPVCVHWTEAISRFSNQYESISLHVIAIDQGLVVPNQGGMRPVERMFAKAMMKGYRCGAHASNLENKSCYGTDAGIWKLVNKLNLLGYLQSPEKVAAGDRSPGRYYFECYPHPAIIGLFELDRTLQYKAHKKNATDWNFLVQQIRELKTKPFPIENICTFVDESFRQNKQNEDKLDSIIAAYTAAWLWRFGWKHSMCLGDSLTGYLVTPVDAQLRATLNPIFPKHAVVDLIPPGDKQFSPEMGNEFSSSEETISAESDSISPAVLTVNDTGCIWGRLNDWMNREFCEDHVLEIRFKGISEEPTLRFVQFEQGGRTQFGMRVDEDSKLEWKHISSGCSNENLNFVEIEFRYISNKEEPLAKPHPNH